VRASILKAAAELELKTAPNEAWVIQFDFPSNTEARIYLELADGSTAEAERGLGLLKRWAER
jgi:hypothetical protein